MSPSSPVALLSNTNLARGSPTPPLKLVPLCLLTILFSVCEGTLMCMCVVVFCSVVHNVVWRG